jgi:hypothetical protein
LTARLLFIEGDGDGSDAVILAPRPGRFGRFVSLEPIDILADPPRTEIQERCPDSFH